ncbi:hypothetical protein OG792_15700 [Micromonospora sp. NBC_01699]|uniref:hypothetical protein n=1 Tax=Micromonospora sp. NBC_01699 TaxID=2975984 RepID=UPI002E32F456|nr:hypothetical protein [Micromonospora sp. NBC_01699]
MPEPVEVENEAAEWVHRGIDPTPEPNSEYAEHDRYFQVRRVRRQPVETFLRGLVRAYSLVRQNADQMGVTNLDATQWRNLFAGLHGILGYARVPLAGGVPPMPTRPVDEYLPHHRWLVGHQLFFAVVQGAIVGLNCFVHAAERGDEPDARAAVGVASDFMRSSAAAIRFTADFGPVDYDKLVRPAMAPPAVRAGFSGLQTRDHAFLVGLFTELRTLLARPGPGRAGADFEEFVDATIEAYDAHQFICARFGGDVLPSLRMAANSQGRTTQSGADALRQIMRARLFTLTGVNGRGATA